MQQRQLRLGDVLDDYCPRERRVTNHAVVAMVGPDVKQTRCTTCDAEHEYKHAKVPRQRRKAETPAVLYSQVLAGGPKRVVHEQPGQADESAAATGNGNEGARGPDTVVVPASDRQEDLIAADETAREPEPEEAPSDEFEGPVHRPLIRATLPRPQGQPPPTRPAPEFTIRQPGGRPNRFRPRHARGSNAFFGGAPRPGGGRPSTNARHANQPHGRGRKRSK
ncbi:MAG: hypothetical protein ACM3SQ_04600 [Betaproteobacteria bacterium]